jgi:hypothetical protein
MHNIDSSVRRLPALSNWIAEKQTNRDVRRLRKTFAPKVADAEQRKEWHERDELLNQWQFEESLLVDPIYARASERLTSKARRYGISAPPRPTSYDTATDDWWLSNATGEWILTTELESKLRREIRDERRARYDELRKWGTLIFAVVGTLLATVSLQSKQKQPDPCSRNYYRNDSGECIFALQKDSASSTSANNPKAPTTQKAKQVAP